MIACRNTDGSLHGVPMPDAVADLDLLLRALVCPETVCLIVDLPNVSSLGGPATLTSASPL